MFSRSSLPLDVDPFEMFASKKKDKEDDEDSGFRSRVNSVTHSCSPASSSAFSSEGGSPQRKISTSEVPDSANSYTLGVETQQRKLLQDTVLVRPMVNSYFIRLTLLEMVVEISLRERLFLSLSFVSNVDVRSGSINRAHQQRRACSSLRFVITVHPKIKAESPQRVST
ncbi:hypothetical protein ANCCAN_11711 [Ancylostoma caninum]|uniref:Uncharacterized protein n=1 Tax=Ancylostoma caninum TaxID=29170 RepID=A0A368GF62_ANCCA|nr:hypothetical protein ANCCAN_11711 [Ancylostoma caninum]